MYYTVSREIQRKAEEVVFGIIYWSREGLWKGFSRYIEMGVNEESVTNVIQDMYKEASVKSFNAETENFTFIIGVH